MPQSVDAILLDLLRQEQATGSGVLRLIDEHAAPIIRGIIKNKLNLHADLNASWQTEEDLYGDVIVQLLTRVQAFLSKPFENPIADFRGYIAVTAYNACNLYLRKKYPSRWRLKNRLRYTLTRQADFKLWENGAGEFLCGLAAWAESDQGSAESLRRLRQVAEESGGSPDLGLKHLRPDDLPGLLRAILNHVRAPVPLEELLSVVADLQGIRDQVMTIEVSDETDVELAAATEVRASFAGEVEQRSYLRRLWTEISALPPMQRTALLLNLKDAQEGVIALLPLSGIASIRQVAEVIDMPVEKFAGMWNQLPLDDATIAELLQVSRQQVINLRKSARARLSRRMKLLDEMH